MTMQGDLEIVAGILRDLDEAAERWEILLAEADSTTFTVDMGDIHAVANADGRLIRLTLHSNVITDYTDGELASRINAAFAALRSRADADFRTRYGVGPLESGISQCR